MLKNGRGVGTSEWEGEIQVQQEQLSAKFISLPFYFPAGSFISSGNLSSWHLHEELWLHHHGTTDIPAIFMEEQ